MYRVSPSKCRCVLNIDARTGFCVVVLERDMAVILNGLLNFQDTSLMSSNIILRTLFGILLAQSMSCTESLVSLMCGVILSLPHAVP